MCLLGAFFSSLLALCYVKLDSPLDVSCGLSSSLLCMATPLAWRMGLGRRLVPNLALAGLTAIFTTAGLFGAVGYLAWLGLVTIVAFMLLGRRGGLRWMVGIFALVGLTVIINSTSTVAALSQGTVMVRMLRVVSLVPTLALIGLFFEQHRRNNIATLETAVSARSRLLANVSHEMRTPLNGIIGLTQALRLEALPAQVGDRLQTIEQSGEALLALINALLDVAAAEAGNFSLAQHPFELGEVVERTVALNRARPEAANGIELVRPAEPLWVTSDAVRVQQVLGQLVTNALRHGRGAPVTVELKAARQDGRVKAELCVTDRGPGLDPLVRARIFQPNMPFDPSTAPDGSGLGLHVSRALARQLGGDLSVHGHQGAGCSFCFELDLPTAEPKRQVAPVVRFAGRVLVVDDNAINRKVATALLAKLGLEVEGVESGELALERLASEPVGLVLMDLQMPGLDGLETTRRLRGAGFKAPIVALTASAQPETPVECAKAGMDGYLVKPLRLEQLVPELERFRLGLRAA